MTRVSPEWLDLREPADAAARDTALVEPLRRNLSGLTVVHDLGCGTGSMARWLAPRLPGPQHWVMYDRDPDLLAHAKAQPVVTADGVPGTVETRQRDITRLAPDDLDGASVVTASALLDMLTRAEVERVVAACVRAGCPALFTISVTGHVTLDPPDPLDAEVMAAFNAHQRRTTRGRPLLGPDAVDATVAAFERHGVGVRVAESPWRLGPAESALTAEWFDGWLGAAVEQRPDLAPRTDGYGRRRRAQAAQGGLRVVVRHTDLLAGVD
jgi:SAM-dependent methyltransferase